jgi:hypothetical protein
MVDSGRTQLTAVTLPLLDGAAKHVLWGPKLVEVLT